MIWLKSSEGRERIKDAAFGSGVEVEALIVRVRLRRDWTG